MAAMEVDEAQPEVPAGNPQELTKNPVALKEAHEQMATLDVLVCGQCHAVFHFVDEFKEHKETNNCTGKSPVRDSSESKAQVWAFLLWKCSSTREGSTSVDNSWKLYQQWCRMPEAQRTAWITAGTNVQALSKFAHAKVIEMKSDDQLVPVQTTPGDVRRRGRPRKIKQEEPEPQPSGEESDEKSSQKLSSQKSVSTATKPKDDNESVRGAQERVPAADRIAKRTEREAPPGAQLQEYVVEKILAKRFNPRQKHYEYLLKWEGYPHEQNTWEPLENMETCKHLLEAFEKQLARQKELKALRAQQQALHPVQVKQTSTPLPQVVKQLVKKNDTPALTPTGRLQRSSKARALDQVKAWCGSADDEPPVKRARAQSDNDYSDPDEPKLDLKTINGQQSPKASVDPELVKSLGLSGKGMPNIKGVIKVDPKHMPNLSTGVYIMSKSSGIMKIDSPGKIGPGLNIDQDVIKKQIMAAKQKKMEENRKQSPGTPISQIRKTYGPSGQHVTEKTIITPSGQKIIQRTIQRPIGGAQSGDGKSPVTILNKKLAQSQIAGDSLLRRGGSVRGRGRGNFSLSPNIMRVKDKSAPFDIDKWSTSSESSDGVEDPFPQDLGPIPPTSPDRPLTLCPLTGKRLARAENEPTPPPTPSPPPTPPPETQPEGTMLMKVEMSPGGTTGIVVQGEGGAQPSLPVLTDDDGTEMKVEASAVKQLLEEGVGVEDNEEVGLQLHSGHAPIMIRGEDGVLYQVAGENEAGQTLLVAAEGVEGAVEGAVDGEGEGVMYVTREDGQTLLVSTQGVQGAVEGVEAAAEGEAEGVTYVTRNEDGQDVLTIDPTQLAQLLPGGEAGGLQQVAVQMESEGGEEATQVIAQLVQAELPSPGGTRRVVLLLPDGTLTMTELDKEQYESITEAGKAHE
ncbi:unnamed protein product [Leptosia nina]|uniref:Chromo domain-containing protein n=1 Tax=Leptosia nina TaxID=320188 RepID=A0AAV1K5P5_9NEOP